MARAVVSSLVPYYCCCTWIWDTIAKCSTQSGWGVEACSFIQATLQINCFMLGAARRQNKKKKNCDNLRRVSRCREERKVPVWFSFFFSLGRKQLLEVYRIVVVFLQPTMVLDARLLVRSRMQTPVLYIYIFFFFRWPQCGMSYNRCNVGPACDRCVCALLLHHPVLKFSGPQCAADWHQKVVALIGCEELCLLCFGSKGTIENSASILIWCGFLKEHVASCKGC